MFVQMANGSWYDSRTHALDCPKCGPNEIPYLHMVNFHKYDHESISIRYVCEHCGKESVLNLEQHKGQTYFYFDDWEE